MKRAIISLIVFIGVLSFLPIKGNTGEYFTCEVDTGYIGGEVNGVFYDMGEAFVSTNLTDEQKLIVFKEGCKARPNACCGYADEYKYNNPICVMKYFYVDAVCSNSKAVAKYILESGSLTDKDTLIPRKNDKYDAPYEGYRVNLGGFAAYVGRKDILKYMMYEMPYNGKVSRVTMGDKAYSIDKEHLVTIDKTLYDIALSGRKLDDVENPVAKPFITFIQAEKKKWDARQNFAAKMHDDLVKAAKGGKMAIDNYTGKNLALDGKTYNEINKLLKLNRS